jgi:Dyp-type peroxidase family
MAKQPIKNTDKLLSDIQANILKGHGRRFAAHVLFNIKQEGAQPFLNWLAGFEVTSAKQQLEDGVMYKTLQPPPELTSFIQCLYLSFQGYKALGWEKWAPEGEPFRKGMKKRQSELTDPPVENWDAKFIFKDKGKDEGIDGMLLIAHDHQISLHERLQALYQEVSPFLDIHIHFGRMIRNESGDGIEHFGYVDGISQPLFLEQDIERFKAKQRSSNHWDPSSNAEEILLAWEPKTGEQLGSYFVFRKLEQNVKGFKESEEKLAEILRYEGESAEIIGAYAVGRFENGAPVVLSGSEHSEDPLTNNFNYKDDTHGRKCPFHAHIRKVNPRDEQLKRTGGSDTNRRLIARRGIPYDEFGRRFIDEANDVVDPEHHPSYGVGLLFMAFMNDIEDQFEFIQQNWANSPDGPSKNIGVDPVIGQTQAGNNPAQQWPITWGNSVKAPADFHGFVTMKGGEYFFAPSVKFLKQILSPA